MSIDDESSAIYKTITKLVDTSNHNEINEHTLVSLLKSHVGYIYRYNYRISLQYP